MSFDKPTRNLLARMVSAARERLKEDITAQLQTDFRLQPDGSALPLEGLTEDQRAAALDLRQLLDHLAASEPGADKTRRASACDRLVREIGFTVLNRLAALRLCEERELVVECVRKGMASDGFTLFDRLTGGALGSRYETYRAFLENLFDELALDLGVLFDRRSPLSHVLPTERALQDVLDLLNDPALAQLWREDETIGWIYQYYNDEAERRQMHDDSPAPRNSRELAVRNQFFTPRYVVEFLTDNTLGRIWHEMRGGETRLAEQCRYLVRQPSPPTPLPERERGEGARVKKDPRDIRILDPASGSCHFLLYAFDLLTTMYEEAWADPDSPPFSETGRALRDDCADLNTLRRETPGLILRHNLHGIDIDPRAVQIGGLALWLRAQRSFQQLGLRASERPRITRVNVVCAEPMPGERDLLDEFVADLQPPELGELVRFVFDRMQLAGEAGSLLKIEEELRGKIEELRTESGPLFAQEGDFWENAETRVLEVLKDYAERAANGTSARRQLFADDAVQGFAFIDFCRKHYDMVLMNPPFGEFSRSYKNDAKTIYPNTYNDIFAAFIDRFLERLEPDGLLGAITSRTGFFLGSFTRWRQEVLLKQAVLRCLADLGTEVMDEAMVEAAAYCLERSAPNASAVFFRLLGLADREYELLRAVDAVSSGKADPAIFIAAQQQFEDLPESPFIYWVSKQILHKFSILPTFEPTVAEVRQGLVTGDNVRFVRAIWEIQPYDFLIRDTTETEVERRSGQWAFLVMTGASQPWYSPITVVVNWKADGVELKNFVDEKGKLKSRPQNIAFYFRPGFSWTLRAVRFIPYIIPAGCIPTASRYMAFPQPSCESAALGVTLSNVATAFLRFYGEMFERPKFLVENLKALPVPFLSRELKQRFTALAQHEVAQRRRAYQNHEPFHEFTAPVLCFPNERTDALAFDRRSLLGSELDTAVAREYGFDLDEQKVLDRDLQEAITAQHLSESADGEEEDGRDFVLSDTVFDRQEALISYILGCVYGRWDIRIALDPTLAPRLQGPFDPLPVCSPGMLVGPDGLPATPGHIVSQEWLRARPNAITLPTLPLAKADTTIPDTQYPLSIAWDGILVDDPGLDEQVEHPHPADILRRVREALTVLWGEREEAIEQEACEILGVASLRDYFRKPSSFFADHLKRYSKSRRQAPIYWPLSAASGRYTVWVYYHRLNADTLYSIVVQYVTPKIDAVQDRVNKLGLKLVESSGKAAAELRDQLSDMAGFLSELKDFRAELLRVATLPYKPDLNDGVIINAAPLNKLFRLRKWANDTAAVWKKLEMGEYDWAHLAYTIWPERVKKVCEKDRSIAIAHGLEHLCKVEVKKAKGKRKKKGEEAETIEMEFDQ